MMDKVPMTAGGYAALTDELKRRQSEDRPRIIEHIAEARSHGDLSENAEYHAAKEEQSHNEGRIAELEDKLARADIIDISKLSGDTIKFGATVTLIDEDTEKKAVWQIVGEVEADAKKGIFVSSSYDATTEFETTCDDILAVYQRVTGEPLDLEKYSAAHVEAEKAQ